MEESWEFRGNERGYFCPSCQSRCLCDVEGDWLPSEYCPHCGKPLNVKKLRRGNADHASHSSAALGAGSAWHLPS